MKQVCHSKKLINMNKMPESSGNITSATIQLAKFIRSAVREHLEVKRIAICTLSLIRGGTHPKGDLFMHVAQYIIANQQNDGGWADIEETLISVKFLSLMGLAYNSSVEKGNKWLLDQRNPDGGWGRTNRDISRIPVTGLLLHILPALSDQNAVSWLKREWATDFEGATRLTYKGGFFLLGLSATKIALKDCPLIKNTYLFLAEEQNEDGGFGPWKDHPIGSDPWTTGIVLLGLLSYPELVKRGVVKKAVNWLAETQLHNGL